MKKDINTSVCKPPAFKKELISICLQFWVLRPEPSKESHGEIDLPTQHQCREKDPTVFHYVQHSLLVVQVHPSHFPGVIGTMP